jgi:hypothetical protein
MSSIKRRLSGVTKKKKTFAAATVVTMAVAAGALAYFTSAGTGSGTASVGTASSLTVTGTSASTLYPGTSSTVSFTVDNPSSGHQRLGSITLSGIHACTGAGSSWNGSSCSNSGTEQTTCESFDTSASSSVDNFSMPVVTSNTDFAPGNNQTVTQTGTLTMNDLNSSQNSCQGANLTLSFTTS